MMAAPQILNPGQKHTIKSIHGVSTDDPFSQDHRGSVQAGLTGFDSFYCALPK
jgi:hypothetical protein